MNHAQQFRDALDLVERLDLDPISLYIGPGDPGRVQVLMHADDLIHLIDDRGLGDLVEARPVAGAMHIRANDGDGIAWIAVVAAPAPTLDPLDLLRSGAA
jgi:hypothetical protein